MNSPITKSGKAVLEDKIPAVSIVEGYKQSYGIDVGDYFKNIKDVEIYKCLDTGYRFYYPFNLSGDAQFYVEFQKFSWYYMEAKWEYDVAEKLVKSGDKVLEIGCGTGAFLQRIKAKGAMGIGLELNAKAVKSCRDKNLQVTLENLHNHAEKNAGTYDVVCSFQVVEHIAGIGEFMEDSIKALKHGGTLIVSVPNNDCLFLEKNRKLWINMPPHHMGLWNKNSLLKIQSTFLIKLKAVYIEPLQPYHYDLYTIALLEKIFGSYKRNKLTDFIIKVMRRLLKIIGRFIGGQTIMATYEKNN